MSTSMVTLIAVMGVASMLVIVLGDKPWVAKPTDSRSQMVDIIAGQFFKAWLICEFLSYALAPYGVEISFWQAFFGQSAISVLVNPNRSATWREWVAYKAAKKDE